MNLILRALARALAIVALSRDVQAVRSLEFDESKHPRDSAGKFSETEGGPAAKKPKSPPATKDQIAKAWEMYKAGSPHKKTAEETGLNPKQIATIVHKLNKKQEAAKQAMADESAVANVVHAPASMTDVILGPAAGQKGWDPNHPEMSGKSDLSSTKPATAKVVAPAGEQTLGQKAFEYNYDWKEKTSGPSKGKFAYFKDGVQVSAPFPKGEHEAAAQTLHYGAGPKAPLAPFVASPTPDGWPIGNDVARKMGNNYPDQVDKAYTGWRKKSLTPDERDAIKHYTGSGSGSINSALRTEGGMPFPHTQKNILNISSALDKAPHPPPPELVWRGCRVSAGKLASLSAGDTIELKGFQSTSINPSTGQGWSGGTSVLEIKPAKGAYIRPISSHKGEYEYLLPHGMKYRVRGMTEVKFANHTHKTKVIQLEMLK